MITAQLEHDIKIIQLFRSAKAGRFKIHKA